MSIIHLWFIRFEKLMGSMRENEKNVDSSYKKEK